jgi:hypothetical protein
MRRTGASGNLKRLLKPVVTIGNFHDGPPSHSKGGGFRLRSASHLTVLAEGDADEEYSQLAGHSTSLPSRMPAELQ